MSTLETSATYDAVRDDVKICPDSLFAAIG